MMEVDGLWEAGKAVIQIVIIPAIGLVCYIFKRNEARMDIIEKTINETKTDLMVLDERVSNLKDDIKEIKDDIKEIKGSIKELLKKA